MPLTRTTVTATVVTGSVSMAIEDVQGRRSNPLFSERFCVAAKPSGLSLVIPSRRQLSGEVVGSDSAQHFTPR